MKFLLYVILYIICFQDPTWIDWEWLYDTIHVLLREWRIGIGQTIPFFPNSKVHCPWLCNSVNFEVFWSNICCKSNDSWRTLHQTPISLIFCLVFACGSSVSFFWFSKYWYLSFKAPLFQNIDFECYLNKLRHETCMIIRNILEIVQLSPIRSNFAEKLQKNSKINKLLWKKEKNWFTHFPRKKVFVWDFALFRFSVRVPQKTA